MTRAFVDTSVLLAMTFREAQGPAMLARLQQYDLVHASNLLEAEVRSACRRERSTVDTSLLEQLHVVLPTRPLSAEITRVLDAGYVRGADCWHLATALYLVPDPGELTFVTLDLQQREVANALGFAT